MIMLKKYFWFVFSIIFLIFLVLYFIGYNMSLSGDRIVQATEVDIEWYDYQGIQHLKKLLDSEKNGLAIQLGNVSEKHKLFLPLESRTGELSYNIYCYGVEDVQYTVKGSGIIIVQNRSLPYEYTIWKINQEEADKIISYIKDIDKKIKL